MREYIKAAGAVDSQPQSERVVHAAFQPKLSPMLPSNTFKGQVALVTGGGTGLGRAMSTTLSSLGATVVIASRKLDRLQAAAQDISKETGNPVHAVQLDVRDDAAVARALDEVERVTGLPDVVINNAYALPLRLAALVHRFSLSAAAAGLVTSSHPASGCPATHSAPSMTLC